MFRLIIQRGIPALAAFFLTSGTSLISLDDLTRDPLGIGDTGAEVIEGIVEFEAETSERGLAQVVGVELQVLDGPNIAMSGSRSRGWSTRAALGRCNGTALYRYSVEYRFDMVPSEPETYYKQFPAEGVYAREIDVPTSCPTTTPEGGRLFRVNDTQDLPDGDPGDGVCRSDRGARTCTLRAAVMEANASDGADLIVLPKQRYVLSRQISGERELPNDSFGDLDITDSVVIVGEASGDADMSAVLKTGSRRELLDVADNESLDRTDNDTGFARVDGGGIDRVFDVHEIDNGEGFAVFRNIAIVNGRLEGGLGAGIRNAGNLRLDRVIVAENTIGDGRLPDASGIFNRLSGVLLGTDLAVVRNRGVTVDLVSGFAGGLLNNGSVTLDRALFSRNVGRIFASAIVNWGQNANMRIVNTMVTENVLKTPGSFGAGEPTATIGNYNGGKLEILFSTITRNTREPAASSDEFSDGENFGLTTTFAKTWIGNTILEGEGRCIINSGRPDYFLRSLGGNIIAAPSRECRAHILAGSDVSVEDIFGVPTFTTPPRRSSGFLFSMQTRDVSRRANPIDAGASFTIERNEGPLLTLEPIYDSRGRGFSRNRDGNRDGVARPDIGAYEFQ